MRVLEGGFADVVAFAVAGGGLDGEAVGYILCIGFLRERRDGRKGYNINFEETTWMRATWGGGLVE